MFRTDSKFCNYLGIEHRKTNAYHPQAQGAIERMHRILNSSLRSLAEPLSWHKRLPYITLQINNEVSGIHKFTLNQVVFGRPGRLPGTLMTHGNVDPTQFCSENIRVFLSVMTFHEHIARPLRDNNPFIEKELSSSVVPKLFRPRTLCEFFKSLADPSLGTYNKYYQIFN